MSVLSQVIAVAIGGALGALSRFGVQSLHLFDHDKYYYTVAINISGCMLFGMLWALFSHYGVGRIWYLFVFTGFLGGYTTYSAFTLDAIQQVEIGRVDIAFYYIVITLIGGLGGCALALWGTRKLLAYFAS